MTVAELLRSTRTIAVVGLSPDPFRPSHGVAEYMQARGYRIIPVNPNADRVLGERSYPDLESIPEPVDMVNIFRRSELVGPVVESAIRIGAKSVWMQEGVVNQAAADAARAAGIEVVMDRCLMVEHRLHLRS
jgi:predicted CoA-binding protein